MKIKYEEKKIPTMHGESLPENIGVFIENY